MPEGTTCIVIFGASGDLAQRKLVPALFTLRCKGRLPDNVKIIGFSRSQMSDDQFRDFMWNAVQEFGDLAVRRDEWDMFAQSLFYVVGDLTEVEHFNRLKQRLKWSTSTASNRGWKS